MSPLWGVKSGNLNILKKYEKEIELGEIERIMIELIPAIRTLDDGCLDCINDITKSINRLLKKHNIPLQYNELGMSYDKLIVVKIKNTK